MITRKVLAEILCYLLMLYFFYEGLDKIAYLNDYGFYIKHAPLIRSFGNILKFGVPILEILLAMMIMNQKFRKVALYSIIILQLLFIFWVMSVYLFTGYLFWPYKALWNEPTWMQKMILGLFLSWISFTTIILLRNKHEEKNKATNSVINTSN